MDTTRYITILREKEQYPSWARGLSLILQERHPEASRMMVWDEVPPTDETRRARMNEARAISAKCLENIEEPADADAEAYKLFVMKMEQRTKYRAMVTSAIGFVQTKITPETIQMIRHLEEGYVRSIADFNLVNFWESIKRAMSPKGMAKIMTTAMILRDLVSLKQGSNQNIVDYVAEFSKKAEEIMAREEIKIDENVLSSLFVLGTNDNYNGFRNYFYNKEEDDAAFVTTREEAIRWKITNIDHGYSQNAIAAAAIEEKKKSNTSILKKKSEKPKRKCFACGNHNHLMKDCPRLKSVAANAIGSNGNDLKIDNSSQEENYSP